MMNYLTNYEEHRILYQHHILELEVPLETKLPASLVVVVQLNIGVLLVTLVNNESFPS